MVETTNTIALRSVGVVHSSFQASQFRTLEEFAGVEATVEVLPEFAAALDGLCEGWSTAHILYHLDRAEPPHLLVHPHGDRTRPKRGVFATRSPTRPNHIALTTVELLSRDGCLLRVRGLDALDGSPVFDIHPAERRNHST